MEKQTTDQGEDLQRPFIDLASSIRHDTNDYLLPAVGTPHLGSVTATQVRNIFDDTAFSALKDRDRRRAIIYLRIHSAYKQNLVFVVHGHDNEEFCLATIEIRTERIF